MPSRGRGGEQERRKERLETWLNLSKDVRLLRDGNKWWRESAIDRACKEFGLRGEVAEDRELLLGILADVIFYSPPNLLVGGVLRKRGRPEEWSKKKKRLLSRAILEVCSPELSSQAYHKVSDLVIARRLLKSRFKEELDLPGEQTLKEKISQLRKGLQKKSTE
jgi:hypothetical protein